MDLPDGTALASSDAGPASTDGGGETDAFSDDGDFGAGTLCSLYAGPVDSCDGGSTAGPVQRCGGQFTVCAQEFDNGWWGCCVPNPPGGLADCYYGQVLDAGCE